MHPHPIIFLEIYFSGIALAVVGFFFMKPLVWLGIFVFILGELSRLAESFRVMESGIAREYRLLSTNREFTEYYKIQNLEVTQSFVERLFGVGDMHFDTSGSDKAEIVFRGVKDPYKLEHIIREEMKKDR